MDSLLVRIKPRDPHRGHVLRRFVYRGIRFETGKGWYQVRAEVGEYLRTVHQHAHDPHSPLAFDVCTEAEAKALDEQEAEATKPARPADRARPAVAREPRAEDAGDSSATATKGAGKRGRKGSS